MTRSCAYSAGMIAVLSILPTNTVSAQLMSTCVPDSPERRGGIGCSILPSKLLPDGLTEPVFWHIDRFDSPARAPRGRAREHRLRPQKSDTPVISASLSESWS